MLCEEKCASFDNTEAVKLAPSVTFVRSIETLTDNFEDDLCDRTQQSCSFPIIAINGLQFRRMSTNENINLLGDCQEIG